MVAEKVVVFGSGVNSADCIGVVDGVVVGVSAD